MYPLASMVVCVWILELLKWPQWVFCFFFSCSFSFLFFHNCFLRHFHPLGCWSHPRLSGGGGLSTGSNQAHHVRAASYRNRGKWSCERRISVLCGAIPTHRCLLGIDLAEPRRAGSVFPLFSLKWSVLTKKRTPAISFICHKHKTVSEFLCHMDRRTNVTKQAANRNTNSKVVWEMGAGACLSVLYVLSLTILCPLYIHLSLRLCCLYIPRLSVVPVATSLALLM